jgi:hypothetical protein
MKTILMHGPGISNPAEIVEREVPECDVQAYKAAGYVEGGLPKEEAAASDEPVRVLGGLPKVVEAPAPKKKSRAKK